MASLIEAAATGNSSGVEKALGLPGASVNYKDGRGWTPLHWAAKGGHCDVIDLLLAKGARIDEKSRFGDTALHKARQWGQAIAADHLVLKGSTLDRGIDGIRMYQDSFSRGIED